MPRDPEVYAEVCAACDCESPSNAPVLDITEKMLNKIDFQDPLHGTVKEYTAQFIITSGEHANDWPKHTSMSQPDGPMNELQDILSTIPDTDKYRVNCITRGPSSNRAGVVDVLVFQADGQGYQYKNIEKGQMEQVVQHYLYNTKYDNLRCENIDEDWIFTCGHSKKDLRCGVIGKAIDEQLAITLSERNLNNVQHDLISHIGGHKYAGNVIIYTKNKLKCLWYGRVTPAHVNNLIYTTFIKKEPIPALLRARTGAWKPE